MVLLNGASRKGQHAAIRLLVLDLETPWVRSLFDAMPSSVTVDYFGVLNLRDKRFKPSFSLLGMFRTRDNVLNRSERYIWTLTRLKRLTALWLWLYRRVVFSGRRKPDVVVFAMPSAAEWLPAFRGIHCCYDAHDVFEFYRHLDPSRVRDQEQQLLEQCDTVVAVARKLKSDFEGRARKNVLYLPMATTRGWVEERPATRPIDLPGGRLVVGCVGQINQTYDWQFIRELAERRTECNFVFIGPIIEGDGPGRAEIDAVFALPNVAWLGPRAHVDVPAYLHGFDVCFIALRMNAHNDRRSPLRLFDYLTTDRPVLTTAIAEAYEHAPHVMIAADVDEADRNLCAVLASTYVVDVAARQDYIRKHTWEARATELLQHLNAYV